MFKRGELVSCDLIFEYEYFITIPFFTFFLHQNYERYSALTRSGIFGALYRVAHKSKLLIFKRICQ